MNRSMSEMNSALAQKLLEVGERFRVPGLFFSYEELKSGNVNHTYKVNYIGDDGKGMARIQSYLVQKINTVAFTRPVELMANIEKVTTYIQAQRPEAVALAFFHTEEGKNYLMDDDGFWRMSNYIPSVTFDQGDNALIVRNTGVAFGDFQVLLRDFDASSLYFTIPDFHNTRKRYENLKRAVAENRAGRAEECREEIDWLLSVEDEACRLTDLYNEGRLPLRVTHNDTKINNVLFDKDSLEPLVVIDLDTVMPGLVGHDFGDAVRFAANFAEEDCDDVSKIGLDLNTFWAFTEGFLSKTAGALTPLEIETLGTSCFALACELSARFLSDYLDGDVYFKVKRDKHNLIRTKAQIALAKDMLQKMDAMTAICTECGKKYQ